MIKEEKIKLFEKYGEKAENTGSAEAQVALFTSRILHLTSHLKKNKKDFRTKKALTVLVGKRKKLLRYLEAKDIERYRSIIKSLKLRK